MERNKRTTAECMRDSQARANDAERQLRIEAGARELDDFLSGRQGCLAGAAFYGDGATFNIAQSECDGGTMMVYLLTEDGLRKQQRECGHAAAYGGDAAVNELVPLSAKDAVEAAWTFGEIPPEKFLPWLKDKVLGIEQ